MKQLVTPKQVARAIGVSESSLKRWCDDGRIPTRRTAGGHRRLPISGVLEFLKQSEYEVVHPELLGLPSTSGHGPRVLARAREALTEALTRGDEAACQQIILDLYLVKHRFSSICDNVIAPAFRRLGELWECKDVEVYQERRACDICEGVMHALRSALPSSRPNGRLAMGATPEGDPYRLPTLLVELVLRENGWHATSLGSSLPFDTLAAAIEENRPQLFWLSASFLPSVEEFLQHYATFYDRVSERLPIVVGGQALSEGVRQRMKYAAYCDTLQHLESFVSSVTPVQESTNA